MKRTTTKKPTQHEAGGTGRKASRGNLRLKASPFCLSRDPQPGLAPDHWLAVVLGEGMMGRGIGAASVWEAGTAMLSAGNY